MVKAPIIIEKVTVSDPHYLITDVYLASGKEVKAGDLLFSFETSKSAVDVEAPEAGYFVHQLAENQHVQVGDTVAYITASAEVDLKQLFKSEVKSNDKSGGEGKLSAKAAKLLKEHNIDVSVFAGKSVIKEKDILDYIASASASNMPERIASNDVIIIGGKGGAKMVIEAIRSNNSYAIKGIIDSTMKAGETVLGVAVLGGEEMLQDLKNQGCINVVLSFTSLSKLSIREDKYLEFKKMGFRFPNIIHARATVEPSVLMGEGNVILANSMLGSDVRMGNMNFVNTGAMICHDTMVYQNNHFAPNAVLAGRIKVGKNNLFGMCSTTFFDVEVGNGNIINNGVHIFSNIANDKIIRTN